MSRSGESDEMPDETPAGPGDEMASFLYLLALVSTALALVGGEDRRVTAGLFVLAGLDVLYFAVAFSSVRLRVLAFPTGVVVLWLAAWASRPHNWLG